MMMAEPPSTPSRHEKSLGLLTIKFVNLLQEAHDGVLDLKVVSITIHLEIKYVNAYWTGACIVLHPAWFVNNKPAFQTTLASAIA